MDGVEEQKIALVTGANKGIGYEIAAGLGARGFTVGVGARDTGRREEAVARLRAAGVDAFGVPLDVTDDASVTAAAALLAERGGLDVLVNNAATAGAWPMPATAADIDVLRSGVETNVYGVVRVTNAVLPLLRRSPSPRVVNLSSSVGSLTFQATGREDGTGPADTAYSPTKTYLNAITLQYVRELAGTGILINNVCPGYVATDLNGHAGHRTPRQGAAIAVEMATIPDDGPTGTYVDENGPIPW
ncbi:NADP-dependent 3-hydroxy acid dehydrogenase YdfG [Actinokineospora spheciospongiae]|nr:NADP-dependent 3-hydroxy acid dehydrogenase YdfG [Actinokineospora spheciospongiae]